MTPNLLNKSEFAGINRGSLIFISFLITTILFSIWIYSNGNIAIAILIPLGVFFALLFLYIWVTNKITVTKITETLSQKGEVLQNYFWAIYEVNQTNSQKIEFTELGRFYIDVIVALSNKGKIYIRPTATYSKQPVMEFPINSIESINIGNLEIPRPQLSDWQNSWATTRGGQGIGLPANQINTTLDQYLPLDRNLVRIKTASKEYEIAIHKKQFNSFRKIFETKI